MFDFSGENNINMSTILMLIFSLSFCLRVSSLMDLPLRRLYRSLQRIVRLRSFLPESFTPSVCFKKATLPKPSSVFIKLIAT